MTLLGIIIGLLPGFVWLRFYLHEDLHPEPKGLVAYAFIAGAGAALAALLIELPLHKNIFPNIGIAELSIYSLLIVSTVEELFKFSAAYLAVHKSPAFDEPVDAMVYTVVAALGFATVENIGAATGVATSQAAALQTIFQVTSLRFIGATLLHSLTSATVGYFWALDIRDFLERKNLYIGLAAAVALHTVFNYLILQYGNLAYIVMFLSVVGFFVLSDFEKLRRLAV